MAFPPVLPPTNRANATLQLDAHPADHNMLTQAIADVVAQVPRGIAVKPIGVGQVGLSTTVATVATLAIAGKAGRSYKLLGFVYYSTGATATSITQRADDGGAMLVNGPAVSLAGFYLGGLPVAYVVNCGAADRTITMTVRATAGANGTGAKSEGGFVWAEDVGATPP